MDCAICFALGVVSIPGLVIILIGMAYVGLKIDGRRERLRKAI